MRILIVLLSSSLILSMAACSASRKMASTNLNQVNVLVQQAEQSPAQEFASVDLYNAKEKYQKAKSEYDKENYDQANLLIEEVKVDLDYAMAKGKLEKVKNFSSEPNTPSEKVNLE